MKWFLSVSVIVSMLLCIWMPPAYGDGGCNYKSGCYCWCNIGLLTPGGGFIKKQTSFPCSVNGRHQHGLVGPCIGTSADAVLDICSTRFLTPCENFCNSFVTPGHSYLREYRLIVHDGKFQDVGGLNHYLQCSRNLPPAQTSFNCSRKPRFW